MAATAAMRTVVLLRADGLLSVQDFGLAIGAWSRADEPAGGAQTERPRLPRRVRIEIELERASDRARRTFLSEAAEQGDAALVVDDASRLPRSEEAFVLVDAEWMRVGAIDGDRAPVTRAERGTQRARHEKGAMVHYGFRHVRDVRLAAAREE